MQNKSSSRNQAGYYRYHWHPLARWLSGPMDFTASITKRDRNRQLRSGVTVVHTRFVVSFRDPGSGRRKQLFFKRQKDAIAMRDAVLASVVTGTFKEVKTNFTVASAVDYWLENRRSEVKPGTWDSYKQACSYIVGPLLVGSKLERHNLKRRGITPEGAQFVDMLGPIPIADLTTAHIRTWHRNLTAHVSGYTANVAKKFLRAALALTAEDHHLRVPPMPSQLGRGRPKQKKLILTPDQVGILLRAAHADTERGLYYAFPFLTGVRPSEQLALLWEDVDLAAGTIHIRRMQERDGSLTEVTKTAAGLRTIPMCHTLSRMMEQWHAICPRRPGERARVFPSLGRPGCPQHKKRGGPLSYANFTHNYWRPAFTRLGLPLVTPHSARHAFISTLQASGIEVGLVAKLAGHSNATVTLAHYTQAVRGGEVAVQTLEEAFSIAGLHTFATTPAPPLHGPPDTPGGSLTGPGG